MPKQNAKNKGNILVICAHSDDQVLGAGASMAKLSREGYNIYSFILSYGESSHPHMKLSHVAKTRVSESKEADAILGGSGVFFMGLKDTKIGKDFQDRDMSSKLKRIFKDYKPKKIFTHSLDDLLPDHKAVRKIVVDTYDELNEETGFKTEIYSFDVWTAWKIKERYEPMLVYDVTSHFKYKIRALHAFKSQINVFSYTYLVNLLYVGAYISAFINGLRFGYRLAEVFHRLR